MKKVKRSVGSRVPIIFLTIKYHFLEFHKIWNDPLCVLDNIAEYRSSFSCEKRLLYVEASSSPIPNRSRIHQSIHVFATEKSIPIEI